MSTVVVDAAAVVDLLCELPPAGAVREELRTATNISAPSHLDAEVLSALDRRFRSGELRDPDERIAALADFSATRWPLRPLLAPAWALINQIAVRDALYVALALSLDATLVTTDDRLRKAAGGLVEIAGFDAAR